VAMARAADSPMSDRMRQPKSSPVDARYAPPVLTQSFCRRDVLCQVSHNHDAASTGPNRPHGE